MPHVRTQIRSAAKTLLEAISGSSGVYPSRVYPLHDADLPCYLIFTDDEDIQTESMGEQLLERDLVLNVRPVVKSTAALDDELDAMILAAETALNAQVFGGLAKKTVLSSIRIQMEAVAEKPVGVATMAFTVTYFTTGANPAVAA
jgi:hypothetical protein